MHFLLLLLIAVLSLKPHVLRADATKDAALRWNASIRETSATVTAPAITAGTGHRFAVRNGEVEGNRPAEP
jgi:hypothetical protein